MSAPLSERGKPCPFCGSTNLKLQSQEVEGVSFVECNNCGATGPMAYYRSDAYAVDFWNYELGRQQK